MVENHLYIIYQRRNDLFLHAILHAGGRDVFLNVQGTMCNEQYSFQLKFFIFHCVNLCDLCVKHPEDETSLCRH
jgi:hypothetical protein